MEEFYCEEIKVTCQGTPKRPAAFTWRGEAYQVAEVIAAWQDWGFGPTAPKGRDFRFRRHRNCYHVKTASGEVFEIYFDRGAPKPVWILLKKLS